MKINFQQGIIAYPVSGIHQAFLYKTGVYVSLQTTNGRVDVTFANGESNYLHTEASDVPNAWGPIPVSTDTWLFWDIDSATAVRTFGITLIQPLYGNSLPISATQGQHFFHTTQKKMYLYDSNAWRPVIRVFAAKINNSILTPLGSGFASRPYAGSQVGLTPVEVVTGRILVDDAAMPIRRPDGRFFTTEDRFFANGSPATAISLEANALTATAQEHLSAYQVVYYSSFGKVNAATYDELQQEVIAMLTETLTPNQTGTVITQGTVTNPDWNWTAVGAKLWVDGTGTLVETDPHTSDPLTYPNSKPAIGRVITPTTIFFDQGLGGIGEQGQPGPSSTVDVATSTIRGISKLSVAASDPSNPIVVGTNDSRLSDARVPLSHNQPATTITFTPYGNLTAATVQLALQQVETNKVNRSGDTLTGPLTLPNNPTSPLHAATKQYVDQTTLNGLSDVTILSAAAGDIVTYNGTVWTNSPRLSPVVVLTDGPTITPNFASSSSFTVSLAGNRTLGNPTNQVAGQQGTIIIQQTVGDNTLTYGSDWIFPDGVTPSLTASPDAVDMLTYYVISPNVIAARLITNFI